MKDTKHSSSLSLLSASRHHHHRLTSLDDFNALYNNLTSTLLSTTTNPSSLRISRNRPNLRFMSTSLSIDEHSPPNRNPLQPISRNRPNVQALMKRLSVFEKALIGAGGGGLAGAFTYVCLLPLDAVKTKLQTKGASEIYKNAFDVIVKTFQSKGILGFYSGVSAVIVGSTASSAVYFGTCEFGKSVLSKLDGFPAVLIPPTAGAMGNIVSSAIMVPKELITQRLYAGYSATLLRNLPAGVLSYSSFEYLKAIVLSKTGQDSLDPAQSVCCGALAGAISASITTPLDVVKTRLMTQVRGDVVGKAVEVVYGGVRETVKQILREEGLVGFTRGMGPRVLYSGCFSAIGYFAFETARLAILHRYIECKQLEMVKLDAEIGDAPT
ncbi:unnamed protein product [Rhodiola kirilowii]